MLKLFDAFKREDGQTMAEYGVVLAVIFAGKGVAALQEAGKLPSDAIAFLPRIDLRGVYPNWESVGLQLAMVAIAAALVLRNNRRSLTAAD